jgi:transitional endoplasmic reticulum ATPase
MSRARRSVSEKDLTLFEEFAEKQKAGRGEAANNFKFGSGSSPEAEEADNVIQDDLYS